MKKILDVTTQAEADIRSFFYRGEVLIMDSCHVSRIGMRKVLVDLDFQPESITSITKTANIIPLIEYKKTDLLMMDIYGEDESVADCLRTIMFCVSRWPTMPVLVCTDRHDLALLKQLSLMGVWSICLKQEPLTRLKQCIRDVLNGLRLSSPVVQRAIGANTASNAPLTLKEITVLDHIFLGHSITRTAQLLHRDIRTISSHKRNAMAKLGYVSDADMYKRGTWLLRQPLLTELPAK